MSFYNPYNFVPALPRTGLPDGLADGRPPGHHRWHDDRWSGEIDVAMTVVTPLLLMRERAKGPDEHRELEVAVTADGRVDLAPTQLKGMIRNAFEMATNSRLGVFDHRDALGYRARVEGAADLLPALVEGPDRVVLLGKLGGLLPTAKVELWSGDRTRTRLHEEFAHGDVVEAVVRAGPHGWEAVRLHRPGHQPRDGYAEGRHLVAGLLHGPGPTIKNKRHEAVFVTSVLSGGVAQEPHRTVPRSRAAELVDGLARLVAHQRMVHRSAAGDELWADGRSPWQYRGHDPGDTAWSRHLFAAPADAPAHLGPDTVVPPPDGSVVTCWAEPDGRTLRPVKVSRLLHRHPPEQLLDPSLRPARRLDELSPADRVFGWTWHRSAPGEARPEPSAHRGQLRIVDVQAPLADEAVENLEPLTIPPLSAPKPGQGRFYLGETRADGPPAALHGVRRDGFFQPGLQQLRGRKVYPHQRALEGLPVDKLRSRFRYRPPRRSDDKPELRQERDSQNVTLHQWVRPGARFTFTLRVVDLHPVELGALLWLLDPQRSGNDGFRARHRLGMGRPLGFGAVELEAGATRLYRGSAMRERLSLLSADVDTAHAGGLADDFEKAASAVHTPVLDALRAALAGYSRAARVHYPRNDERSPVYSWFVANESGPRRALPTLLDGESLEEIR